MSQWLLRKEKPSFQENATPDHEDVRVRRLHRSGAEVGFPEGNNSGGDSLTHEQQITGLAKTERH